MDEHAELCQCDDCIRSRLDFNAWCNKFNERWNAHKKANAELAAELDRFLEDMSDPAFNAHPQALR
jgi:hypothetical protein